MNHYDDSEIRGREDGTEVTRDVKTGRVIQ